MSRNVWVAAALLGTLQLAAADEHAARTPLLPLYVQECGSCHVAYAPGLLPAASWQRLLGGLQRHFGSNAELDATSTATLGAWLQAHAASGRRAAVPPQDRITQASWFQREHRELQARLAPPAGSRATPASDCAACHTRAAEGSFREREIRLPPQTPR